MRRVLSLPVDGEDPPARAVMEQLKAVDAARERLFSLGVTRFVGAPDVGDAAPLLHAVGHGVFKKSFPGEEILTARGVLVGRGHARTQVALVIAAGGNHARAGIIEAAEA